MLQEYFNIFLLLLLSFVLSLAVIGISMVLILRGGEVEKLSAYECGFHPFEDTREKFDVRFYLVSILFIIFDLEVVFLFPWCLKFLALGSLGYMSMMAFLIILIIGFFYEWKKGALDWE
jgi:NADH-quinone oxidoreductase subunit A